MALIRTKIWFHRWFYRDICFAETIDKFSEIISRHGQRGTCESQHLLSISIGIPSGAQSNAALSADSQLSFFIENSRWAALINFDRSFFPYNEDKKNSPKLQFDFCNVIRIVRSSLRQWEFHDENMFAPFMKAQLGSRRSVRIKQCGLNWSVEGEAWTLKQKLRFKAKSFWSWNCQIHTDFNN